MLNTLLWQNGKELLNIFSVSQDLPKVLLNFRKYVFDCFWKINNINMHFILIIQKVLLHFQVL